MVYQTRYVSGLATALMLGTIITIIVSGILTAALLQTHGMTSIALLLVPAIIARFIMRYFQQKIEVGIMDNGLAIRYLHQPFCDHNADRHILATDISSYTLSDNGKGKDFTLHLNDSSQFNCTVGSLGYTKDFDDMTAAVIQLIQSSGAAAKS